MFEDVFTHVRDLWWVWPCCLLFLGGAAVAARSSRARPFAAVAPGLVSLGMLAYVGHGIRTAWSGIDGGPGAGLGGISAGLTQATVAGVLFGVPVLLACLAIAAPVALQARDARDDRPERLVFGSLGIGGVALLVEGVALARLTGLSVELVVGLGALALLLWTAHTAAAIEAHLAHVFPVGMVAVWFAVVGLDGGSVLGQLARTGATDPDLGTDPWVVRLVALGLGLAFAGLVGRGSALVAVPVVVGALLVGSTPNVLVAVTTPAVEGVDWRAAAHRW